MFGLRTGSVNQESGWQWPEDRKEEVLRCKTQLAGILGGSVTVTSLQTFEWLLRLARSLARRHLARALGAVTALLYFPN